MTNHFVKIQVFLPPLWVTKENQIQTRSSSRNAFTTRPRSLGFVGTKPVSSQLGIAFLFNTCVPFMSDGFGPTSKSPFGNIPAFTKLPLNCYNLLCKFIFSNILNSIIKSNIRRNGFKENKVKFKLLTKWSRPDIFPARLFCLVALVKMSQLETHG